MNLSYQQGVALGFPSRPQRGQVLRDLSTGREWEWVSDGRGLNGLGFWRELLSIVTGAPLGPSKKDQRAADQILAEQKSTIDNLITALGIKDKRQGKKLLMIGGIAILALIAISK